MNLLQLARQTLESFFQNKKFEPDEKTKSKYSDKRACFVTLNLNNQLRGCIGSLQAIQELWRDVTQNTINAAFNDPRFMPLTKEELNKIKIEISTLSKPKKLEFKNEKELLEKINNKIGIILKRGSNSATFLPQVWQQIPDKIQFLEHLSQKAGLNKDAWKNSEIWFYNVNVEGE